MLYLTSGANGAGKTLFTLKDVRELQLSTNRDVYYNGRFNMVAEFGWKKIDVKDWESVPDGAIFLFDECHNDFPLRQAGSPVPRYVSQLAEHRARGFDFFLITQHPQNVDVFIRRLIGAPGWHRHFKVVGPKMVSEARWSAVNPNCEKPGSSASGETTMRRHPTEVYQWYVSSSLHTGRPKIPRAVILLGLLLLVVPALLWVGYSRLTSSGSGSSGVLAPRAAASGSVVVASGAAVAPKPHPALTLADQRVTPAEYIRDRVPRIAGLPHTAPLYDTLTAPQQVPQLAACLLGRKDGKEVCLCWSQQATLMPSTPDALCRQVVAQGYFVEWERPPERMPAASAVRPVSTVPERPSTPEPGALSMPWGGGNAPAQAAASSPAAAQAPAPAAPTVVRPLVAPAPAGGGASPVLSGAR